MEGLKMIVRWLLGVKSSSASTVNPTLRLLYSMVLSEGDLTESKRIRSGLQYCLKIGDIWNLVHLLISSSIWKYSSFCLRVWIIWWDAGWLV